MNSIQSLCININLNNLVNSIIISVASSLLITGLYFIFRAFRLYNIGQYILPENNKIPYVELDLNKQIVRNIGMEAVTDIELFKINFPLDNSFNYMHVAYICALPNLIQNQKENIQYIPNDCLTVHEYCFLLQYSNISGIYFWTLIIPTSPRGDNFIQINPHFIKDKHKLNIASNKCECPRWIKIAVLKDKKKYNG